jgi:hypothetical protein
MGGAGRREFRSTVLGSLAVSVLAAPVSAQEATGQAPPETTAPTLQDLAKDKQNPFAEIVNLPFQTTTGFAIGPQHNIGDELTVQPRLPFALGGDWNLILRTLVPVAYSPVPESRFGLGDIQPSFFLTPSRGDRWTWGIGPAFQLPTATSSELGTGKWSAGPTGALIYSEGPWFAGLAVTQLWSFAGAPRPPVNLTSVEPDLAYNFDSGWYIQFDPTISYDWTMAPRDSWIVPLGLDVGKAMEVGGRSLAFQIGAYSFVKRPTDAEQWIIRAQIAFLFPR